MYSAGESEVAKRRPDEQREIDCGIGTRLERVAKGSSRWKKQAHRSPEKEVRA